MPNDAAAAFRWVRFNIARRGGDGERLFLFGHSSGCHLAANLGANPKYLRGVGLKPDAIAGVIAMGCILAPLDQRFRGAAEAGVSTKSWRNDGRNAQGRRVPTRASSKGWIPIRRGTWERTPHQHWSCRGTRALSPANSRAGRTFRRSDVQSQEASRHVVPGTHFTSIQNIIQPQNPTFAAIRVFVNQPTAAGIGSRPRSVGQ